MSNSGNSNSVYGGDEINAIVLDPGSFRTRIGYAGDDFPKIITPSYYTESVDKKRRFDDAIDYPKANQQVKPILKDSVITDWDAALEQYQYYFDDILKIDYQEQPLLITEPVWNDMEYRQNLVETFYEKFDFPALYLAKSPTCVSFQQGRPNCIVVDIGHDSVSVVPVVDGMCLLKNAVRTHYGGHYLDDQIEDMLKVKGIQYEGKYKIKSKVPTVYPDSNYTLKDMEVTQSFDEYQRRKVLHEFKETLLQVPEKKLNVNNPQQNNALKEFYSQDTYKRLFELPTGQSIELSNERFKLADSLFDPLNYKFSTEELNKKYPSDNGELSIKGPYDDYRPLKRARKPESTPTPAPTEDSSRARGLSQLITHVISSVDIDLRTSVAHNIIVTGGVSLIPQLTERLYTELSNSNPGLKIRLHAIGNTNERLNQTWIGGSVLASLGTFHQMWVSKEEYKEVGPDRILTQRFR